MTTTDVPTTAASPEVSPQRIFEIAQGFMASKHLFAASQLGVFEALGEGPVDLAGLAARLGLTPRTARISADAMVALGLLEREGENYANTPIAATFLSGATPADFRPLLKFWDRLSYPVWEDLAGALGRGRPVREIYDRIDDEVLTLLSDGVAAATAPAAHALPQAAGLPRGSRVLDIGGGTGSWSIALAASDPDLSATVYELPDFVAMARAHLSATPYANRLDAHAGDVLTEDLPGGYDAFLLANVVHLFERGTNQAILRRIRAAADPGARLLIADFWTDPTHTQPLAAALMAGEFAINVKDGDVYSADEAAAWLRATGWRPTGQTALAGPITLLTAEAV